MPKIKEAAATFLASRRVAVTVSPDSRRMTSERMTRYWAERRKAQAKLR